MKINIRRGAYLGVSIVAVCICTTRARSQVPIGPSVMDASTTHDPVSETLGQRNYVRTEPVFVARRLAAKSHFLRQPDREKTDTTNVHTHIIMWSLIGLVVGAGWGAIDGYHRDRTTNCPRSAPCQATQYEAAIGGLAGLVVGAIVGTLPLVAHALSSQ